MKAVPRLIAITDAGVLPWPELLPAVEAALEGGLPAVMLRDLTLSDADLMPFAIKLRRLTERSGARLLVNRRIELARAVRADGVHTGRGGPPPRHAAALAAVELAGYSAHSYDEATAAIQDGADYVFLSPIFATRSKPGVPPLGTEQLRRTSAAHPNRVLALGGIDPGNIAEITAAGAHGIAMIRAIFTSPDPRQSTRLVLAALG